MKSRYGITWSDEATDAFIELSLAFDIHSGWERSLSNASGFEGSFIHYQRAIDLIYNHSEHVLIWNDWTEGMLKEMLENTEWVISGPSSCVSGDTRLWNPITNESPTIRELQESNVAPIVQTLFGPEKAKVPFIKGVSDLFEIVLASGSRYYATSEHLVLCPEGYVRVGSLSIGSRLFGYARIQKDSTSDNDLLIRAQDVHGSQKTVEDFQDDCRCEYRYDDEQLHSVEDSDLSSSPSLADVLEHNQFSLLVDDSGTGFSHIRHGLRSYLHSSSMPLGLCLFPWNGCAGYYGHPKTVLRDAYSFLPFWQSHSTSIQNVTFSQPVQDSFQQHSKLSCPYPLMVHEDTVMSIRRTSKNIYYDITVPKAQHYFAEGAIHHNSWKSTCAACFGHSFWLADPLNTKVIPNSTTLGGLRERIWKDILKFHRTANPGFGNVVHHPTPKIQTQRGDDSSGIHGIAVEQGDIEKAIDKIRGRHKPRMCVLIDEGTGAQQAIVDACLNLQTGSDTFRLGMLGNPSSYFDQHGRLSEPEHGWNSVTVDDEKWRTKRGGICIHLDGLKSPNVLAGRKKYPGMISQDDIDLAIRQYGDNSPRFWQERRGFWPPEGLTKTVLTEAMIEKFHARDQPIWVQEPILVASLDPAFEGSDRRVLRFGKVGMCDSINGDTHIHHRVLCPTEMMNLKVDVTSKEPIHYQIARQTREECKARGVDAEYFGMDSTGEGGGVAAIFHREWSEDFVQTEFGGYADKDRAISDINPRPAREEYVNKVTQLWFQFRMAVERNQIRGLDDETAKEFCQRNVDYVKYAPRVIVESKSQMKGIRGRSPDLADALVVMMELCLVRGLLPSATIISGTTKQEKWSDFAKKMIPLSRYAKAS